MILKGEIRNCRQMEVYGYVEGDVAAQSLLVHQGGRCFGTVKTDQAEIHGTVQGDVVVKHLINIRSSGSVTGNVQYGQLAMEVGANLSAEVRNVPPDYRRRPRSDGRQGPIGARHARGPQRRRSGR